MEPKESREPWLPIVSASDTGAEGELAAKVAAALDDLAAELARPDDGESEDSRKRRGSLADGPVGVALFQYYLDRARPGEGHDERALANLEMAIESTGESMTSPGLYGGFTGVAWVLEHLTGRLLEPPASDEDDPGEEVAAAINDYLNHTPWTDDYDLISGLVGLGVWAVERGPRKGGAEAVQAVVSRLAEMAERSDEGITWRTSPTRMLPSEAERDPQGNFNLGVAHGVPGVVGVLAEMESAGVAPAEVRELLDGAVAWLWRQAMPEPSASTFAYSVAPGREATGARLAWCYGDAGIAACMLHAARAAGDAEAERRALAMAHKAAARPHDGAGIQDGGLCHGAAGLVHLYNRLYQATRDEVFRREAIHWLERLFELRHEGKGFGGWSAWRPLGEFKVDEDPVMGWVPDAGFLTGSAGIGLALLGVLTPVEPEWDHVLLSSVRPRSGG